MAAEKKPNVFVMWARPDFVQIVRTHKNFKTNFHGAMLYAHYELSAIELKKEVVKYLKHLNSKHPLLEQIKDIHEYRFTSIGKYLYILNNGGEIPEDILPKIMPDIERTIREENEKQIRIKAEEKSEEPAEKKIVSIQDRVKERSREIAGEIEGWLDDFIMNNKSVLKTVQDFVSLYSANNLKPAHLSYILSFFENRVKEPEEALTSKDKDLQEAYSCYTKPELKKLVTFYNNLISSCGVMKEVVKVARKPKIKKAPSTDKLLAKLKYKKSDTTFSIVSVNPAQLINSKEVWCFNTKTRKLMKFIADDLLGPITIKGSSLIGFNETLSISKTLKKPADQLAEFKKAGKVQLRTFMDVIKSVDIKANPKLTEDIVILKVI